MDFDNLHQILRSLYEDMTPLCSDMTGVAKGIAGLGALIYVAVRVWQSLARTEPIDVYPLLRPFAVLPFLRSGDNQHGAKPCSERYQPDAPIPDF